ncbi:MAG: hypothetical protein JWP27_1118 [Flaviaesturariibacter sp.]|nr:hypothetical protein [Flaviaesturariibacter sp.]
MTEKLLHFIWGFGYFNPSKLTTIAGEPVRIIRKGRLNANAGPDFLDAQVQIGTVTLAGSIELHLKTTDWDRHRHEGDPNYRNVILHVVYKHDQDLPHTIPVVELQPRISTVLIGRYEALMQNSAVVACGKDIATVPGLVVTSWKERLLAERLTRKADLVFSFLDATNGHWEEAAWWLLARTFGMQVNTDAFESIARSIPVKLLARQRESLHQVEAVLFGQARLLTRPFAESYPNLLRREYTHLQAKYRLKPVFAPLKFMRMRPSNFPTVRLAQLAMLVHTSQHLLSKILDAGSLDEVTAWLGVTANDYWHYHYRFGEETAFQPKRLGADMIRTIVINTVAPLLFAYGLFHKKEAYGARALQWLDETAPEHNAVTKGFEALGLSNKTAFDSQALLQLKKEYCDQKQCLSCAIGNAILGREPGTDQDQAPQSTFTSISG